MHAVQTHSGRVVGSTGKVGERNVQRLILVLGRGQSFWKVVHQKHENEAENEGDANISMRVGTLLHNGMAVAVVILFIAFGRMYTSMAFSMSLGRVVVATLLRLGMLLRGLLLILLSGLLWRPLDDDIGDGRLDSAFSQETGVDSLGPLRGQKLGRVLDPLLLARHGWDLRLLHSAGSMRMGLSGAVHGLDALGDNDYQRSAHKHTGAEEGYDAELSRRKREGERKNAGQKGAVGG